MQKILKNLKKPMKNICLVLSVFVFLVSCCPSDFDGSVKTLYVDKIFMNEMHLFTFMTDNNGTIQTLQINCRNITVYSDIPKGERMYIEFCKKCSAGDISIKNLIIHIHSLNDISGGGWNHGKFGRGQTVVIE